MPVTQAIFRAALLNAELPVPDGLTDANGRAAGARFSVYRNNVFLSLSEALATAFPLVQKLLGTESFMRLATLFVRAHPPSSPVMMFYGQELPGFLEDFAPLKQIGYLPDCARLDLARRKSYHAQDSTPFDAAILQSEQAAHARMVLAPSTSVVRSKWPLYDIWRFNMETDAPKPRALSQDILITRPDFDPQIHLLPSGGAAWLGMLDRGMPFVHAVEEVSTACPDFDLSKALTLALSSQALIDDPTKDP